MWASSSQASALQATRGVTAISDDGLQRYDQVCAISQAAINRGFIKLFEDQPLASRSVHWNNQNVFDGQLVATMLPPQIELDVESGDGAKFTLQLRFDKGRILFGRNTYQTIDNWVIAFTPLSFEDCLNPNTGDLAAAATLEDIEENVDFRSDNPTKITPGEYSVHRIFAAIADLNWGTIIWERSYMTQPSRQKLYLDEWARDPANNALYNEVQQCLREWTLENRLASCFTQGMLLKIPKVKVSSGKVTLAARSLRLQNYPYIEEERQLALSTAKQPMKGKNGSPYNCLCFCEVTGNRVDLPGTKLLPFSGNLAGPSKGNRDEYLGTLTLDRHLFPWTNKLWLQLQDLCLAMQTIPLAPEARIGGSFLPSGRQLRLLGSTMDLTAGKPYRWQELKNDAGTASRILVAAAKRKSRTSSLSKITIEAGPQSGAFKVRGEYGYSFRSEYSSVEISDIASWSFNIIISGADDAAGNLAVFSNPLVAFTDCTTERDPYTGSEIIIPNDLSTTLGRNPTNPTWLLMRAAMKVNIGRSLARMLHNITPFHGINKFIHPGNGEFTFGTTSFDQEMNLFADIDFSAKNSRVSWPSPKTTRPENRVSAAYISDVSVTSDTPHLTWTSLVNAYDPLGGTVSLSLTALNNYDGAVAFKSTDVVFLKIKALEGNTLFTAAPGEWEAKNDTKVKSTETWSIVLANIDQALDLKTSFHYNGLMFRISPTALSTARDGTNLPSKFIIPSKGSFTLELTGLVHTKDKAGVYIVQLNEFWTSVRPSKPLQGRASTFLVLELKANGQQSAPYVVTQAAADAVRGVTPPRSFAGNED